MSPTSLAAAYVLSAGVPATVAAKRFDIAAAGVRRAVRRAKQRRLSGMPRLELAVALVAAGEATDVEQKSAGRR